MPSFPSYVAVQKSSLRSEVCSPSAMNAQQPFKLARWCASNATTKSPKLPFYRRSKVVAGSSVVLLSGGTAAYLLSHPPAPASPLTNEGIRSPLELLDAAHLRNSTAHLEGLTATELLRSWLTYTLCTSSTLVTWSPAMIDALRSFKDTVPVLGPLTWHVFCGVSRILIEVTSESVIRADTPKLGHATNHIRLLCRRRKRQWLPARHPQVLRQEHSHPFRSVCLTDKRSKDLDTLNVGPHHTAYAAEIDQASPPGQDGADRYLFTENVDIYKRSIIQAAQATTAEPSADIKPTWVGIRFNGITRDPTVLTRASKALDEDPNCYGFPEKSPHLSQDDQDALHYLYEVSNGTFIAQQLSKLMTHMLTLWKLGMSRLGGYSAKQRSASRLGVRHLAVPTGHRPSEPFASRRV